MKKCRKIPMVLFTLVLLMACGQPAGYVSRAEFGDTKWPLTVEDGVLACDRSAITFTTGGRTYALNGVAIGRGIPEIQPIQKTAPLQVEYAPVARFAEDDRRSIFASAVKCEDLTLAETTAVPTGEPQAACEAKLRETHDLTEEELEQISMEGVARSWPPLSQTRMSVGPLIDRGLKLCPS